MNYIENNLLANEKIIYFSRIHWIVFGLPLCLVFLAILLVIFGNRFFPIVTPFSSLPLYVFMVFICLISALVAGIDAFIRYKTSEYGITNKRILMKTGWIRRNSLELFLDKIEAIYVNQSIPGRLLNYGSLRVVGTGGTEDPFFYIPSPLKFRRTAQQQIDLEEHPH